MSYHADDYLHEQEDHVPMSTHRQCEFCDRWLDASQVREIALADNTEWWSCYDCNTENATDIVELPTR